MGISSGFRPKRRRGGWASPPAPSTGSSTRVSSPPTGWVGSSGSKPPTSTPSSRGPASSPAPSSTSTPTPPPPRPRTDASAQRHLGDRLGARVGGGRGLPVGAHGHDVV